MMPSSIKYLIGVFAVLFMMSSMASAQPRTGAATVYSGDFRSTGSNGACKLSKKWKNMEAILSEKDLEDVEDFCDKCVVINGVATDENSRRHSKGVFAKIADSCSGKECEKGSLRLSSTVMKAITAVTSEEKPVVNWEIVTCPRSSNLRGRKSI